MTIPAGVPVPVKATAPVPMKVGAKIQGELLYPVYVDNTLVLPAGTPVTGSIAELRPDSKRRIEAKLGGDFTPFRVAIVHFTAVTLPDHRSVPISTGYATDGAQIYRAVAPVSHGGFFHQEIHNGLTVARDDIAVFLGPGKLDRLRQFVYSQIPYHPQRIEAGTAWTVETSAAVPIPAQGPTQPAPQPPVRKPHFWEPHPESAPEPSNDTGSWMIQAYLSDDLSSESSRSGEPIKAVVAQPIYNSDHTIAVPEGSTLVGTVTRARPARSFGRTGVLSFNFQQLVLPNSEKPQTVETRLTGADSAANIALNSEGQAKSKPQDKIAIPLLLAAMAARPLDQDGGAGGANQIGKNGVGGAAGLGLLGTVVGLAAGSPATAAGIGYWGAARATWTRWIGHGQKIAFHKNTRIVVETTPRRGSAIKPATAPARP